MQTLIKTTALLLLVTLCSAGISQDLTKEIDGLFSDWTSLDGPGATVAVMKDGEMLYSKGFGSAQIEYAIPNEPSTIFHVASVSKQFTVYAVMLLVQDGKVSWDDDVRKYIPELPDFGNTITLRHLAAHTSGLRDQWNLLSAAGWRMDDVITKEQIMTLLSRQQDVNFDPGDEYLYCNSGYTLLAETVARVSGKSLDEFTQERMFIPLNMNNTLFYEDHERIVKNRSYSYQMVDDIYKKDVLSYSIAGATSLFTTAEDLCTWGHHMNNPTTETEDIIREMNTLAKLNNGETFGGAMGQFVNSHNGHQQIQHGGADAGYRTYLTRFPEQQLVIAVLSNYANFNPGQKALAIADMLLPEDEHDTAEEEVQVGFVEREYLDLNRTELEAFEGTFWNEPDSYSRRLYVNDSGKLMYNRGGNNESELKPIDNETLQMQDVDVDLLVTFQEIEGTRTMVVTINGGEPIVSSEYTPSSFTEEELEQFAGMYHSEELDTHYELHVEKGQLIATHLRTGDIELSPIKDDQFDGNRWYFGTVLFERDSDGNVSGLLMSSGRVRDLRFSRQ